MKYPKQTKNTKYKEDEPKTQGFYGGQSEVKVAQLHVKFWNCFLFMFNLFYRQYLFILVLNAES